MPAGQVEKFNSLKKARADHTQYGGILLVEGSKYAVCYRCNCDEQNPCRCGRTKQHIDQLAPEYDESQQGGKTTAAKDQTEQMELF